MHPKVVVQLSECTSKQNISPLLTRLLLDTETNHTEVLEDVFENQTRKSGLDWVSAPVPFSNAVSEESGNVPAC